MSEPVRRCLHCGHVSAKPAERFCPQDGSPLMLSQDAPPGPVDRTLVPAAPASLMKDQPAAPATASEVPPAAPPRESAPPPDDSGEAPTLISTSAQPLPALLPITQAVPAEPAPEPPATGHAVEVPALASPGPDAPTRPLPAAVQSVPSQALPPAPASSGQRPPAVISEMVTGEHPAGGAVSATQLHSADISELITGEHPAGVAVSAGQLASEDISEMVTGEHPAGRPAVAEPAPRRRPLGVTLLGWGLAMASAVAIAVVLFSATRWQLDRGVSLSGLPPSQPEPEAAAGTPAGAPKRPSVGERRRAHGSGGQRSAGARARRRTTSAAAAASARPARSDAATRARRTATPRRSPPNGPAGSVDTTEQAAPPADGTPPSPEGAGPAAAVEGGSDVAEATPDELVPPGAAPAEPERPARRRRRRPPRKPKQQDQAPGLLQVASGVKGAEVIVNGRRVGLTPLVELRLPPGKHEVVVVFPNRGIWQRSATLEPGGTAFLFAPGM